MSTKIYLTFINIKNIRTSFIFSCTESNYFVISVNFAKLSPTDPLIMTIEILYD